MLLAGVRWLVLIWCETKVLSHTTIPTLFGWLVVMIICCEQKSIAN
jgi:hypothetical protein